MVITLLLLLLDISRIKYCFCCSLSPLSTPTNYYSLYTHIPDTKSYPISPYPSTIYNYLSNYSLFIIQKYILLMFIDVANMIMGGILVFSLLVGYDDIMMGLFTQAQLGQVDFYQGFYSCDVDFVVLCINYRYYINLDIVIYANCTPSSILSLSSLYNSDLTTNKNILNHKVYTQVQPNPTKNSIPSSPISHPTLQYNLYYYSAIVV